jgi:hypothetical protein
MTASTTYSPDVIVLWIVTFLSSSSVTVSSITDGASAVTWQSSARESVTTCTTTHESTMTEWYGVTTAPLSSDVITVHLSGTPTTGRGIEFGISDANTAAPFDTATLPVAAVSTCTTTTAKPTLATLTTNNANDFLIGMGGRYTAAAESVGSIAGTTATSISVASSLAWAEYRVVSTAETSQTCAFNTATTYWQMTCDAVMQCMTCTASEASTMASRPAIKQAVANIAAATLSLSPAINEAVASANAATLSLSPDLAIQAVLSAADSATSALVPAVNQGLASISPSVSLGFAPAVSGALLAPVSQSIGLAPGLSLDLAGIAESASSSLSSGLSSVVAFVQGLSASMSLTSSVGQGLAGVAQSASLTISPALTAALAFFAALSASLSLSPSIGQAVNGVTNAISAPLSSSLGSGLAGITQSISSAVSPTLSTVAALFASLSVTLSLVPTPDQGIDGITNAVTSSLSPTLIAALAFFAVLSASVSLTPSVNQDLAGIANSLSTSVSPSLGQDLVGVTSSVSTAIVPALSGVAAFFETVSASVSLSPAVGQGLSSLTQSVSFALAPALTTLAAFAETISAAISLAPSLNQGLAGLTNALSSGLTASIGEDIAGVMEAVTSTLTPSLSAVASFMETLSGSIGLTATPDQGIAGVTNSVAVGLIPALVGAASFLATLSASLGLAPTTGQGLAGIGLALSSSLTASVDQGLDGIVVTVGTAVSPILGGLVSFFEAVFGIANLMPSLAVSTGLIEDVSVALDPSVLAVVSVPLAASTVVSCSPSVVAEGVSTSCEATVTGVSPTGSVSFSSLSGTFSPSSSCVLSGGMCQVEFLPPPSAGSFTIDATYSGDLHNSPSSETFTVSVPAFNISAATEASGAPTTIRGSGFAPSTVYNYCFESGVTSLSGATPCPSTLQFISSSSGVIPPGTVLSPSGQRGLIIVSSTAGVTVAFQTFTIIPSTTGASIALSPTSGPIGSPVTVTGSGFTPGATLTLAYSNGTLTTNPPTVTASGGGAFTASFNVPPSRPGSNTVAAIASDPGDSAVATFTATNVGTYQRVSVAVSAGGTLSLDESGTTGVTLSIYSPASGSGRVTVSGLTQPSYGVPPSGLSTVQYFDIRVSSGIPGSGTVQVCFTDTSLAAGAVMQYWNGASWVGVISTVAGTLICNTGAGGGVLTVSELSGTNFAIGTSPSGGAGQGPLYVSQSIKLSPATDGGSVTFSLSGCGVIPSVIQGDGQAHHIAAYPGCAVSITPAAPRSSTTRWVFASGNQTLEVTTCSGLNCSSSLNASYYEQVLQNLSYSIIGTAEGYSSPTVAAFLFGSPHSLTLSTTPSGYWLDATGSIVPPALLQGSGQQQQWSLLPSSSGMLSAETPNSVVLVYALQYSLGFAVSPHGAGTTTPSSSSWFNASSSATISATANTGFRFSRWVSTAGSTVIENSTSQITTCVVGGPDTLTAVFVQAASTSTSSTSSTSSITSSTTSTIASASASSRTTSSSTTTSTSAVGTTTATSGVSPAASAFPTAYLIFALLAAVLAIIGTLVARKRTERSRPGR